MTLHFETAIIGAGLLGLGVAERLSRAGRQVLVVEARERPAQVTSSRNSQVLHAALYYPRGSWKARLCLRGNGAAGAGLRGARRGRGALLPGRGALPALADTRPPLGGSSGAETEAVAAR